MKQIERYIVECVSKIAALPPASQEAADQAISSASVDVGSDRSYLDLILRSVLIKDYTAAHVALLQAPEEKRKEIRRIFNDNFLYHRKNEWTGHGIGKTFRYWTLPEKQRYVRYTSWLLDALNERFEAVLGYGGILSLVRDGDFMPHDDDLDVIVSMPSSEFKSYRSAFNTVFKWLENYGFKIKGNSPTHRLITNERYYVDVFVGLEEDGFVSWLPGPRGVIRREEIFPGKESLLLDRKILVPANPERYLSIVYGEDWHTPQPGWSHSFDPKPYSDWL